MADHSSSIYDNSGYLSIPAVLHHGFTYNFIIGARGVGKTYGAIKYVLENNITAIYLRRSQKAVDILNQYVYSPFKPVVTDMGLCCEYAKAAPGSVALRDKNSGHVYFYTAALSTFAGLRSFDMSAVTMIIFDEFIPEATESCHIKNEYEAFLNMYESVNRNRELDGQQPVKFLGMANANRLDNPIFMGLNLVSVLDKMMHDGTEIYYNKYRSISVINVMRSPISERKAKTALYRLSAGSTYAKMALQNDFNLDTSDIIGVQQLIQYKPLVNVGELCIYRKKSGQDYYVSCRKSSGSAPYYASDERSIDMLKSRYKRLVYDYALTELFKYEDLKAKTLMAAYMKI